MLCRMMQAVSSRQSAAFVHEKSAILEEVEIMEKAKCYERGMQKNIKINFEQK